MELDQAARRAAMERLEVFVGEWAMEASFSAAPAAAAGRAVFEWMLDRQFVMERAEVPEAPDSIAIVGFDPAREAYRQHYFDSRGIARVYAMDLSDRVWTLVRILRTSPRWSSRSGSRARSPAMASASMAAGRPPGTA